MPALKLLKMGYAIYMRWWGMYRARMILLIGIIDYFDNEWTIEVGKKISVENVFKAIFQAIKCMGHRLGPSEIETIC